MPENAPHINELLEKLEILLKRQDAFSKEINALREEIIRLKLSSGHEEENYVQPISTSLTDSKMANVPPIPSISQEKPIEQPLKYTPPQPLETQKKKSDVEKFIGENLINKVGIAITVIGVGIGAKYSIEHDLISPLTRIILGYLVGLGLLGVGMRLRKKYENFSAVLESGAIAILYFITYAAFTYYGLIPLTVAFGLMVLFTVFTVVTAIKYNSEVIAIIGLVGAYAVPFLLSEGSGRVGILFSYMAIINLGILFIAIQKYWKTLYYSSFLLTWIIFSAWFFIKYEPWAHFGLALTFSSIFFFTFYFIFLVYKLIRKEKFEFGDVLVLLTNSFVFYGIGYSMLNDSEANSQFLGLFTLSNAVIHFLVASLIYTQKLADRNLFFLAAGLFLIFITIAVPVQLDGNWVTLLWTGEAALLFWIGRTRNVIMYERLSFPLMALALSSLLYDWISVYHIYDSQIITTAMTPFININFLTSILVVAGFFFINSLHTIQKFKSDIYPGKLLDSRVGLLFQVILLVVLYFSIRLEISYYWDRLYAASLQTIPREGFDYSDMYWNEDLKGFKTIWIINYSLFFFTALFLLKTKYLKGRDISNAVMCIGVILLFTFLIQGLFVLSELRDTYLQQTLSAYYTRTGFNITVRYISFAFAGLFLFSFLRYVKSYSTESGDDKLKLLLDLMLAVSIIWIATSELITWMNIMKSEQSYKLAVSILWGVYSLLLVILGIWTDKKHLRIAAIVLFAATLIKLFFYDIEQLSTLAKTVVFVALGILLLIISFLYNKYTHKIR